MTIKTIVSAMSSGDIDMEQFSVIYKELSRASDSGKIVLLERIAEAELAQLRNAVKGVVLTSVLGEYGVVETAGLLSASANNTLDAMLDSYFVAMFGLLFEEEIV